MQDNNTYRHESEFEDFGWQQMQEVLDREMPAKKKRRRGIFLWWLVGVLAIAGIGYLAWSNNSASKTVEQKVENTAITGSENGNIPSGFKSDEKLLSQQQDLDLTANISKKTNPQQTEKSAPSILTVNEKQQGTVANNTSADNNTTGTKQQTTDQIAISPIALDSTLTYRELANAVETISVTTPAIHIEKNDLETFKNNPPKTSFFNRLSFSIAGFGIATPQDALAGAGAQLSVSYPVSARWNVSTGAAYRHMQLVNDYSPSSAAAYFNNRYEPDLLFKAGAEETITTKLDLLSLQLCASRQMSTNWKLGAGLSWNYLFGKPLSITSDDSQIDFIKQDAGLGTGSNINPTVEAFNMALEDRSPEAIIRQDGFRQYSMGIYLETSHRITNALSAQAALHYGLGDISRNSFFGVDKYEPLRFVQLGVVYGW